MSNCEINLWQSDFNGCESIFKDSLIENNVISLILCKFENSILDLNDKINNNTFQFIKSTFHNDVDLNLNLSSNLKLIGCKFRSLIQISGNPSELSLSFSYNQGQIILDWDKNHVCESIVNATRKHKKRIM